MAVEDSHLVVPTSLEEAGPHVRQVASNIVLELEALNRELAPLAETWTGDTFTYFNGLEQEWNLGALGMFGDGRTYPGVLGDIATKLDVAWANYVLTQQTNNRQWAI
jgi:hypothetical protein